MVICGHKNYVALVLVPYKDRPAGSAKTSSKGTGENLTPKSGFNKKSTYFKFAYF
jgi:hypothetical protein